MRPDASADNRVGFDAQCRVESPCVATATGAVLTTARRVRTALSIRPQSITHRRRLARPTAPAATPSIMLVTVRSEGRAVSRVHQWALLRDPATMQVVAERCARNPPSPSRCRCGDGLSTTGWMRSLRRPHIFVASGRTSWRSTYAQSERPSKRDRTVPIDGDSPDG